MPASLQALLELPPTEGASVELFGDADTDRNTMLSRRFGARTEPCPTGAFAWDKEEYLRALAPATGRGAASKSVNVQSPSRKQIGGVYFRINYPFTGEMLNSLRNPGEISANAAAQVQKARRSLRKRLRLSREKLWAMALKGTTTINSTIFPDGTVEGVSISWGVNTLAVSASWNTISTPIFSRDCKDFQADAIDTAGIPFREFMFNESIGKMLAKNTELKDWLTHLPDGVKVLRATPDRFDGAGDIPKWSEYLGSYKPEGGSITRFIGDNELIALPEGAEELCVEARFPMDRPAEGFVMAGAGGLLPQQVFGDEDGIDEYVYATPDPAGIVLVAQMAIQPILRLPEAFGFEADVTS